MEGKVVVHSFGFCEEIRGLHHSEVVTGSERLGQVTEALLDVALSG